MKRKPINMATGGLMSMPPYIKSKDKSDEGITPYDISTPESARKGLPSRLLSKSRTRFSKGKEAKKKKDEVPIWTEEEWEEMNAKKDKIKEKKILLASTDFDKALAEEIKFEEEEFNAWVRENNKRIRDKNKKALGGYMDENDIAEQTPLALNIGGAVGRPEERKDYKAYAEGDLVDEEIV